MKKKWLVGLALLLLCGLSWAGEEVTPGEVSAEGLKPYLAHYRETRMGTQSRRMVHLQEAVYPGGPGFRLVVSMLGRDTVYDEVRMLAADFSPVTRMVSCRSMLHRMEVYTAEDYQGVAMNRDGGEAVPVQAAMYGKRFPSGTDGLALSTMNLNEGDVVVLPMYSSDMGPANANLFFKVTVIGKENVTLGGQSFKTLVIEKQALDKAGNPLEIQGQPFPKTKDWISDQPPYLIKSRSPMSNLDLAHVYQIPKGR